MKAFVTLLLLTVAAPASAAWHRVDSPNFVVVGDASARDLRDIATQFEAFHEVLGRLLGAAASTPVPTVVVVFPSNEAFAPYQPIYRGKARAVGGYAAAGRNVNYIAMLKAGEFTDHVIFHEYTHLVLANSVAKIPLWLNEGLAEFYGTFRLMDGGTRAQIGLPIVEHLRLLNGSIKVPLAELLRVDGTSPLYNEDDRAGAFYAESWSLIHMLIAQQPSRAPELANYLQLVSDGTNEAQAWEQVFGTSRTENALRLYLTRPIVNTMVVAFSEKVASLPLKDVPLSAADTAAFLATLQLRRDGADAAARTLEPALAREAANPLANEVMARIELARQNAPAAEKRLMALSRPGDWLAAYLSGTTLTEAALTQRGMDGIDAALTRATSLLEQARRDHGDLANELAELTRIELERDTPPSAAARDNIARARALAPGRVDYVLAQAQLYVQARDFAAARHVLGPLMTPVYPQGVRDSARRLMGAVVDLERGLSGGASATTSIERSRSVAVPDADAGKPRTSAAGGRFIPVYRTRQAGEQRLDGVLERIDCAAAGKPSVFHVRTSNAVVDLEGQLAEVELLTYRNDLTGGVSCGEREPMRVYVTWREGSSPRHEKVVVAVEFLPKD